MQRLQFGRHVGVAGVELRIAFAARFPPEPVLNNGIQRDVPAPVLVGDVQDFGLRRVAILGLEKTIGPLRKQRRVPGHRPVFMDNPVHVRAVEHVVIHLVAGHRFKVEVERKAVIHVGEGGRVPEDSVALAGDQQRDGDIGVVLPQL